MKGNRLTRLSCAGLSVLMLAGCGAAMSGQPAADPGATVSDTSAEPPPWTEEQTTETPLPTTATATTTAGGGLPQDAACAVVSWADLPPDVRHPTKPPTPVTDDDPQLRKCRLDNSRAEIAVAGPNDPPGETPKSKLEAFIVVVLIGPTLDPRPSSYKQAEPITINGRRGVRAHGINENGAPWCLVAVPTKTTTLAVEVDNNRFQVDVCQLATQVAERVAPRL